MQNFDGKSGIIFDSMNEEWKWNSAGEIGKDFIRSNVTDCQGKDVGQESWPRTPKLTVRGTVIVCPSLKISETFSGTVQVRLGLSIT